MPQARANKPKFDWAGYTPPKPKFLGVKEFDAYDLGELVPLIDWTPFFQTWELVGRYPLILDDPQAGKAARDLFADAQAMLKRIVAERWLTARGADRLLAGRGRRRRHRAVHGRGSRHTVRDAAHIAPADVPRIRQAQSCPCRISWRHAKRDDADYLGGFVVTSGHGEEEWIKRFEADKDDYNAILLRALADRLAEAFAERLHQRVREEFWGYAPDENVSPTKL